MLRLRRLVLGTAARGVDVDSRAQAREPRSLGRALPRRLRCRLSDADPRRPRAPPLAPPRAAPGRSAEMTEPILSTPLRERATQALGDRFLHEALDIATTK